MIDSSSDISHTLEYVIDNIVKIVNRDGTKFYGTGFCLFINQQQYIITCHHCIWILDQIFIEKDGIKYPCKWVEEYSDMNKDLAVLICDYKNIPVKPLNHHPKALRKLEVIVLGFATNELENLPSGRSVEDLRLASIYNHFTWEAEEACGFKKWNNKPKVSVNVFQIQGIFEQGFSGSPVCYVGDSNVIGIFTAKTDKNGYVIPIQTLLQKYKEDVLQSQLNKNISKYLDEGNLFYRNEKYDDAIIQYDEIIGDVNYLSALSNKGKSLIRLKQYDKAIELFNFVLEYDCNFIHAINGMGDAHKYEREYKEAIKWYDKALKIDPNDVYALTGKGIVLNNSENYEKAIEWYDKALKIDPNDVHVLTNKGNSLANLEKNEEAIEWYDKALAVNPDFTSAQNNKKSTLNHLSNNKIFPKNK
jgi:tetratricopeptide (TPR) repeat protein